MDPADISSKVIQGEKLEDFNLVKIDVRLADLIESCRLIEPAKRPSFKIITEVLRDVL